MKKYILWLQALILTIFLCSGQALGQSTVSVLSLEQARELAGAHNRDLQRLYLNLLIAQDKTREARSKALPQLGSSITYTAHQEQPRRSNPNDGGSVPVSDQYIYEACVSVDQALFNLGIWAGIKGAVKYQQMKKLGAERFQETLHYLVSEQYLVILRIQQEHTVLKELEKNTQEHLRDTQNFYQEGLVPKTDLLRTELKLSQVQRDLVSLENKRQKIWTAFSILLGIEKEETNYRLQEVTHRPLPLGGLHLWQQKARQYRNDVKELQTERAYQENILKGYTSKRFPTISAFGNWHFTSDDYEETDNNLTAGIKISWPIYTGLGVTAQIGQMRSRLAQSQLHYQDLVARIDQEVESAYLDLQEAEKSMETAQKEIEQAEENLRITQNLYKEAMATNTDVLDAQMLLAQAKNNLNDARYDQILAIESLWLSIGYHTN